MSTKKLQRTVIEGGRYNHNKYLRRHSHKTEKAKMRQYLERIAINPDFFEEECEPQIFRIEKEFRDKLGPMYRWLNSQVGRKWADVRSEISEKFDTRTTAGRHITFDHLLGSVVDTESGFNRYGRMVDPNVEIQGEKEILQSWYRTEYYVDQFDILRKNPVKPRWKVSAAFTKQQADEISKWLDGKIIGLKDGKYHWYFPTSEIWTCWFQQEEYNYFFKLKYFIWTNGHCSLKQKLGKEFSIEKENKWESLGEFSYDKLMSHGNFWKEIENPFSFKQRRELSKEEVKYFESFHDDAKKQILNFGKNR